MNEGLQMASMHDELQSGDSGTLEDEMRKNEPSPPSAADKRNGTTMMIEAPTLVELNQLQIDTIVKTVPGGAANVQEIYPLSPLQEGMLFHHLLNERSDTYILLTLLEINCSTQVSALVDALQKVIDRHDILRSAMLWENLPRPVQVVYRRAKLPVEELRLSPGRDPIDQVRDQMKPEHQGLDLRSAPLMRLHIAKEPTGRNWYALLLLHHMICDHQSWNLIVAETLACLSNPAWNPPAGAPYRNYVAWSLENDESEDAERFFRKKLAEREVGTAPFGLLDVHADGSQLVEARQVLDAGLAHQLRLEAKRLNVSSSRMFHAAWALVAAHTSGQDDVIFGTVLLARQRRHAAATRMAGLYVNTLPLRLGLSGRSALELVVQTDREIEDLLSHEQTPLTVAQRCANTGSEPLFTTVMNYRYSVGHSVVDPNPEAEAAAGMRVLAHQYRTNYPIGLTVDNLGTGFALIVQTDPSIDPRRIIGYLVTALQSLVTALSHAPSTPALELSILPEHERAQLIESFNATRVEYARSDSVHRLFENQADRSPESIAADYRGQTLTYRGLNSRANRFARYLMARGVGPDKPVALCLERGLEMLVALFGILKAGGAYVPLDPTNPIERLRHVLADAAPELVITQSALQEMLPPTNALIVALDTDWEEIEALSDRNLPDSLVAVDSQNLAYVIYTSGSTGKPKGVMVEHRNIINYALYAAGEFDVAGGDGSLICTSIAFDLLLTGLYPTLLSGKTVRLCSESDGLPDIEEELLRTANLAPLKLTPSHLGLLDHALRSGKIEGCVRSLVVGGEPLQSGAVLLWKKHAPSTRVFNHYGPTETTVGCVVNRIGEPAAGAVPIGRPISNTQIYILDSSLNPVPIGVTGEIYIAGAGVSRGYRSRPAPTAERFIADPFSRDPSGRMYKSGDLGRWRHDGQIECLGRNDHQVKVRGHRIELGEIESQILQHPHVREASVVAREDVPGEKRLVAYIVADRRLAAEDTDEGTDKLRDDFVADWEVVHEQTYESNKAPGPSFIGWNSSYTGDQIPDVEMKEWVHNTVSRIQSLNPRSILEIGCGIGLLLERLAPTCEAYVGMDISASALNQLRRWMLGREGFRHVQLMHRSATELHDLQPGSFDLIVMNSVVQYFPDIDYLVQVVRSIVPLLRPEGKIFLGDIRDLRSLRMFHSALQLGKAAATVTVAQLRRRVNRAVAQDKELVIDPQLFQLLPGRVAGISSADVWLKRGHSLNELTAHRYDVVLRTAPAQHGMPSSELYWGRDITSFAELESAIRERRWESAQVKGIPNVRLIRDSAAERTMDLADEDAVASAVRSQTNEPKRDGIDPEQIWALGEANEYELTISPGTSGCFDLTLHETKSRNVVSPSWASPDDGKPWSAFANDPLEMIVGQRLVRRLRDYLKGRLPEYMVPSAWMVLKQLPLTQNGKIDRRALPNPQGRPEEMGEYVPPRTDVESTLAEIWADLLQVDQVGALDNFFELGGHSLLVVRMMERLRQMGLRASVRNIYDSRTLADLASVMTSESSTVFEVPPNLISSETQVITPPMLPLVTLDPEEIDNIVLAVSGGVSNIQDIYPLTPQQEGILFHHLMNEKEGDAYVVSTLLRLSSREKLDRFMRAVQKVIERHDILRTLVLWDHLRQPLQVVCRLASLPVTEMELDPFTDPVEQIKRRMRPENQRWDLRQAPLLRLQVAQDARSAQWYALLQSHHLVCDLESTETLLTEIMAHIEERSDRLPAPVPYRNHVAQVIAQGRTQDAEAFFRRKLHDVVEPSAPFGLLDVYSDGSFTEQAERAIETGLALRVRAQARRVGVTAATLFHAAWALVVAHTSSRDDVVFGTVLLGRLQAAAEAHRTLGMVMNTLPLRLRLEGVTTVTLVEEVHRELVELLGHEQASLAVAQRCSGVAGSAPLFSSLLNYRHRSRDLASDFAGQSGITWVAEKGWTNYPIIVSVDDLGEGFRLVVETDRRIDPERLVAYVQTAIRSVVQALEESSGAVALDLQVMPNSERRQLVETNNANVHQYSDRKLVHELFEEQAARTPNAVAVQLGESILTYGELNARSNQVAHYLVGQGIGPDQLVGICLERSFEMIIGLMGILKAGGAYVPIDPSYPLERVLFMLRDAAPSVILIQDQVREKLSTFAGAVIALDTDWAEISLMPGIDANARQRGLRSSHLAYVIYTSGSTGQPKGAMNEHCALINRLEWMQRAYQLGQSDGVLQKTPFSFDVSGWEFFWTLMTGARLIIARPEGHKDPEYLQDLIEQTKVTTLHFVPSMLQVFLGQHTAGRCASLRHIVCSGEELPTTLVQKTFDCLPEVTVSNLYGPTEAAIDVTAWECECGNLDDRVPIGKPISNLQMYVLDDRLRPAPLGVTGELYIGGVGVGRGYLNRPVLTAERFVPNPFSSGTHSRLYKTGDLGRWRTTGAIEYLGRNDHQVKIRGLRIELGEIEAQLARQAEVSEAAVVVREHAPGDKRLIAYIVPAHTPGSNNLIDLEIVRSHLKRTLPEYMIPGTFVILEQMPLSPNGKLDRRLLPAPTVVSQENRQIEAPIGDIEEIVAGIWQSLLQVDRVGRRDNFFELGGHSLLIVQVLERLRRVGLSTQMRRVFESQTLADLARAVSREVAERFEVPPNRVPATCHSIQPDMLTLISLQREHIEVIEQSIPGGAANIQEIYPLSSLQEGILFHYLMRDTDGDTYVLATVLEIATHQDLDCFIEAMQWVIDRHEALRTAVFVEKLPQPVQVVVRKAILPVERVRLEHGEDVSKLCANWLRPAVQKLKITHAPLVKLTVAESSPSEPLHVLLQWHHITIDHVTIESIMSEVVDYLNGRADATPVPEPYRSHLAQALLYGRRHDAEEFFRKKLADVCEPTAPFGLMDVYVDAGRIHEGRRPLQAMLAERVRIQARRMAVSSATIFHAAWSLVVAHTSRRTDVVFGTVLSGRMQGDADAQRVLGMFINTLPLRLRLDGLSSRSLVERTQRELVDLLVHEQASLSVAQRCSGIVGSAPLFTALINYRHSSQKSGAQWSDANGIRTVATQERSNYPVVLSVDDLGHGFSLKAQTDARVDPHRLMGYVETAVESLMEALEGDSDMPAWKLKIVPKAESCELLKLFNRTEAGYPRQRLVHELFEGQVTRAPDAAAAIFEGETLSYFALNAEANRLARYLKKLGVEVGDRVAVLMQRSTLAVVAQIAVLKSGGVYVPIDPELPADRRTFIIQDSCARLVLADCQMSSGVGEVECIDCTRILERIRAESILNLELPGCSTSAAYVMYTSGSTGRPKGVVVPHYAISRLVVNNGYAQIGPDDCLVHYSNAAFDASTFEIWGALANGARLVVVPHSVVLDGPRFAALLQRERVNVLWMSVGLFNRYVEIFSDVFCRLRFLIVGGDVLEPGAIKRVFVGGGPQHVLNAYGPTECTTFTTTYTIGISDLEYSSLPIGRPISNAQVYVLDASLDLSPIGVLGEIYIGGAGLAQGYLSRPEQTAERFIPNPFSAEPGARMYRSGDVGFWRAEGLLEFAGRDDYQVKIRGYRVELGEVEAQLARDERVKEAVTVVREEVPGYKQLVAYVVPTHLSDCGSVLAVEKLRLRMKAVMPDYMVPSAYVMLERMPLTSSGKIDRRALPAPDLTAYASQQYEMPRGNVEESLARIWRELLGVGRIGRLDNFFDLGGHSLSALQALLRMEQMFDRPFKMVDLYRSPVLKDLAMQVSGESMRDEFVDLSREAVLDPTILPRSGVRRIPSEAILLTGGTGFVGRFLLAQLLKETDALVYCLVRAPSALQGSPRIRAMLMKWGLWREEFEQRVVEIPGDLRFPKLGIDERTYAQLCEDVDTIYHCGTSMNHLETYSMAKSANVDSAREILCLATSGRPKLINYVSTLGVFGRTGFNHRVVDEQTEISHEKHLRSRGYVASKWVAEKLFLMASERGIPCNVFRLGLVWADAHQGRYDELQREYRLLKSCLLSGLGVKGYRFEMGPTPVDHVARAIAFLSSRYPNGGGVFHISSPQPSIGGLFEEVNAVADSSIDIVPYYDWICAMKELHQAGTSLPIVPLVEFAFAMDEASFNDYWGHLRSDELTISCERTRRELESGGIITPVFDAAMLKLFVERLLSRDPDFQGFGRSDDLADLKRRETVGGV